MTAQGRGFWIGLAVGGPIMGYGIIELASNAGTPRLLQTGEWLVGGLLAHDLVVAPLVIGLVWVIGKALPSAARTSVRVGTLATVLVLALGAPALLGYGDRPDNATVHPLDYSTAVLTSLVAVWGLTALAQGVTVWRNHRRAVAGTRNEG